MSGHRCAGGACNSCQSCGNYSVGDSYQTRNNYQSRDYSSSTKLEENAGNQYQL